MLPAGKANLKDLLPAELEAWFESLGEKPFRARQIVKWLYQKYEHDFLSMTDLSRALRERLTELAFVPQLELVSYQRAAAGDTEKFLFRLPDGNAVESVLMHFDEHLGPGRATLCISTQVGCAMGCVFCASGQAGVLRNLATWEIVDQVLQVQKFIAPRDERIANLVYMGIGEPLANYTATLRSLKLVNHEEGLQIGMRHIAVSTSGLVPGIDRLAREKLPIRLAISLHSPHESLRSELMPINEVYPLASLMASCRAYQEATKRRITFEYCLIRDVNDSDEDAHAVGALLDGIHSLVNIIPLNPVDGYEGKRPGAMRVASFQRIVEGYGIKTTVRQTMGDDIDAACGQLRRTASTVLSGRTLSAARRKPLRARGDVAASPSSTALQP
ncbi:MAG: 23S rRNA (adenine(2503)-C(2))-methyltransferase RlmN [Proteobacteria bacterium]|nr:23S rRNA (adenine(2503)-C(2))-methyltransferase RlmN [Pseudomonadota bacterium]